jgi:hypothetical protein
MKSKFVRVLMLAGLSAGTTLYGGGCAGDNLWRFNPCGTILSTNICSPTDWYARIFDGPDWSVDPSCAIPFQCGGGTGTGGASPGGGGAGTGGGGAVP